MSTNTERYPSLFGIVKLQGGTIFQNEKIITEDLWFDTGLRSVSKESPDEGVLFHSNGNAQIINPQSRFDDAMRSKDASAHMVFDISGLLAVPGFIDIQTNGALGLDYTTLPCFDSNGVIIPQTQHRNTTSLQSTDTQSAISSSITPVTLSIKNTPIVDRGFSVKDTKPVNLPTTVLSRAGSTLSTMSTLSTIPSPCGTDTALSVQSTSHVHFLPTIATTTISPTTHDDVIAELVETGLDENNNATIIPASSSKDGSMTATATTTATVTNTTTTATTAINTPTTKTIIAGYPHDDMHSHHVQGDNGRSATSFISAPPSRHPSQTTKSRTMVSGENSSFDSTNSMLSHVDNYATEHSMHTMNNNNKSDSLLQTTTTTTTTHNSSQQHPNNPDISIPSNNTSIHPTDDVISNVPVPHTGDLADSPTTAPHSPTTLPIIRRNSSTSFGELTQSSVFGDAEPLNIFYQHLDPSKATTVLNVYRRNYHNNTNNNSNTHHNYTNVNSTRHIQPSIVSPDHFFPSSASFSTLPRSSGALQASAGVGKLPHSSRVASFHTGHPPISPMPPPSAIPSSASSPHTPLPLAIARSPQAAPSHLFSEATTPHQQHPVQPTEQPPQQGDPHFSFLFDPTVFMPLVNLPQLLTSPAILPTLNHLRYYLYQRDRDLLYVNELLPSYGVTSLCPTIISSAAHQYQHSAGRIIDYMFAVSLAKQQGLILRQATMLGLHLEGPFIAVPGAHNTEVLGPPLHPLHMANTYDAKSVLPFVSIVTLAPELEGAPQVIDYLTRRGIVVSMGHTKATAENAKVGIDHGASLITHMFNAMRSFHHRDPGMIGMLGATAPYNIHYSVISDGFHAHPWSVNLAFSSNPHGLVLITDSMAAMGLPDGQYKLGTEDVTLHNHRAVLTHAPEHLAGAVLPLDQCLANFRSFTRCSREDALLAVTKRPAEVLGVYPRKGGLSYGSDADIVLLHPETLQVMATIINGQLAYVRGNFFPPKY